ncbi:uncharacterized protein MELLADRAFT_52770 [Melampsora larici-populina 98AG31]|uniref:SNF2 N-terminal domain-containing protein n=1 Tax=Melampsora larici-populina (strain 98AG31 / pathotype 3-4-7) TaxID=747676 RepID=F4RPL1_MELLP|nr:uncharacterized protein MELLADRAFT_52770 [Melampsora larici-populina 98AG31]EGG05553.1 hypothetical protein MELLADRAFT_52770 [Melampsora larici-populina 98AG31]
MQRQRFQDRQSKDDTPVETIYCTCMWRKPQTRKNKTWDGDGILYIRGASCVLKCRETGQELSSGSLASGWVAEPGKEFSVGGKDIEIDEVLTREQIERELSSTAAEPTRPLEAIVTYPKPAKTFKPPMMTASRPRNTPTASMYLQKIATKPLVNRPFCPPSRAETSTQAEDNQETEPTENLAVSSTYLASKKRRRSDTNLTEAQPITNTDQLELKDHTGPLYFVCLYRKMQGMHSSKTSTWGDDGFLVLYPSSSGCMAVLKDSVKGKTLGSMMLGLQAEVRSGVQLKVGGRQLEIQRQADAGEIEFLESGQTREDESGWSDIVKKDDTVSPFITPLHSTGNSLPKKTFKPRFDVTKRTWSSSASKTDAGWLNRLNPKDIPVVDVVVDPLISRFLRPHQVDGVKFMYECTMGMRGHEAQGCILADEMGLGKSIQAIALLWTLLRQNPLGGQGPVIQRAMIVCPVTLVKVCL